jgi:hypothetical protein
MVCTAEWNPGGPPVRFVQKRETDFLFSLAVSLGDKAVSLAVALFSIRRYAINTDR